MRTDRANGFTLIEVLIALVVATLGIMAVTLTTITASRNASTLRERTLGHWVAMNVASELRLADQWPDTGSKDGDAEFAGTEWHWIADVSETDVEALRRVEISVAYAETPDDEIAYLVAFVGQPARGIRFRQWAGVQSGRSRTRP